MKRHILLLEDNDAQARSLEKMIKNYSAEIQISHAATLPRARLLLDSGTVFNAFFLDISLASDSINRKGLQLAMDIRSFPQYSQAPILFITAYPEHISPAINELHCFAYLVKPYTEQELHRQLADLFEGSRSTILLKTSEKIYIRVALDSLQYIYSQGRYLNFVTAIYLKGINCTAPRRFCPLPQILYYKSGLCGKLRFRKPLCTYNCEQYVNSIKQGFPHSMVQHPK